MIYRKIMVVEEEEKPWVKFYLYYPQVAQF